MTTLVMPGHGEPDAGKPARPVRRGGWRNLWQKCHVALYPYSTHVSGRHAVPQEHGPHKRAVFNVETLEICRVVGR
jgi:hypothetical protein